jgi:hypothetical protein
MKDTMKNLTVVLIGALFSGFLGWAIGLSSKPQVKVLIDRPLTLPTERLTVFHVFNIGGAPAHNIEIRFLAGLSPSAIVPITPLPSPPRQATPASLPIPKLQPSDEVSFYIKEMTALSENPRELVEKAVYDEGEISIYTNDDRLNAYVLNKQAGAGVIGLAFGSLFCSIILVISNLRKKKPSQPTEPTPTVTEQPARVYE